MAKTSAAEDAEQLKGMQNGSHKQTKNNNETGSFKIVLYMLTL